MKKTLKRIGYILLIIFVLLLIVPFAFQGQIKDLVKNYLNENLNAKVEFSDVSLSLIRSFPKAHVSVEDLVITNYKPFEDETLASVKAIALTMSVTELFNTGGKDPIEVNSIRIDEALVNLKSNSLGDANYEISKSEDSEDINSESSSGLSLDLKNYSINNSAISYLDEASNTTIYITELDHSGKGIFSESTSQLETETTAHVSFLVDSTQYLNQNKIKLDALIEMDNENQKYTFRDNKALINQLPLVFDGYVQILENGQDIHMSFENPESSFKDFLAVIPETYSKNIADVETTGDFKVHGDINGTLSETTIPQFDITIDSENASFKYPDLPKRVNNISIHTVLKNETGLAEDTYVDLKNLDFTIDEDVFRSNAVLTNITDNMQVDAFIDGTLNLGNISKAYPMSLENHLSGILKAKLNTNFDMNAIETNSYERIKNNGTATIKDFIFSSEDIVNPIQINSADISFKPGNIKLESFDALTGTSDITATGSMQNLLGFLLSNKALQGNFNVTSNQFAISDFMVEDTTASETSNKTTDDSESLKIPEFLDCTINANAKTVLYDNLTLNDVQGTLIIKDQEADLKNLTSNLFDGDLALTGKVSTKSDTPEFDLNLGAQDFDIAKSFEQLELLQNLAPIAKAIQGKLNTMISIKGNLDQEFSPVLSSVSGNAFAELFGTSLNKSETSVLSKLDGALNFIDLDKLDLKDVKTKLKFDEGKVSVEPFTVTYEDIAIEVSGSHSFDKTLDYNAVFQVPAKYLGSDVNQLLGKINDPEVNTISIPVTANITGSYTNPNIQTDLSSGVSKLTQQLIEIEKQKLINKGTDKVTDLLGGLLGGKENQNTSDSTKVNTDSTKTDPLKEGVNNILGGLLKKRKKAKDSTKT